VGIVRSFKVLEHGQLVLLRAMRSLGINQNIVNLAVRWILPASEVPGQEINKQREAHQRKLGDITLESAAEDLPEKFDWWSKWLGTLTTIKHLRLKPSHNGKIKYI